MLTRWVPLFLIVLLAATAAAGCRSASWHPVFGGEEAGYVATTKEVYVALRPYDEATLSDVKADQFVIENLFAWNDQGKPVRVRWVRENAKLGWMLWVYVDASQPTRSIGVQGTVVHKSIRVRNMFRARWEVSPAAPGTWTLASFIDNIPFVFEPPAKPAAGKTATEFKIAEPSKTGGKGPGV
jgi:hypothetical protein